MLLMWYEVRDDGIVLIAKDHLETVWIELSTGKAALVVGSIIEFHDDIITFLN